MNKWSLLFFIYKKPSQDDPFAAYFKRYAGIILLKHGLEIFSLFAVLVVLTGYFAYWFNHNLFLRIFLLVFAGGIFTYQLVRSMAVLRKQFSLEAACSYLESDDKNIDNIWSAVEFFYKKKSEGISSLFIEMFLSDFKNKLAARPPQDRISILPFRYKFWKHGLTLLLAAVLFLSPPGYAYKGWVYLLSGQSLALDSFLTIIPQGQTCLMGSDFLITIQEKQKLIPPPQIQVETNEGWKNIDGEKIDAGWVFRLVAVREKIKFRATWKGLSSRTYFVEPLAKPSLESWKVTVLPPAYTHKQNEQFENISTIHIYSGSSVKVEGTVSANTENAKIEINQKTNKLGLSKKEKFTFNKTIVQEEKWNLVLSNSVGDASVLLTHFLISEDRAPEIILLAPLHDLRANPLNRIDLTYEARDDLALAVAGINVRKRGERDWRWIALSHFSEQTTRKLETVTLPLHLLRYPAGTLVEVQMEARDQRGLSGTSRSILIELENYGLKHQELDQSIRALENQFLDLLKEQRLARIEKEEIPQLLADAGKRQQKESKQNQAIQEAEKLDNKMQDILRGMENDPLTSDALYQNYSWIQESLSSLKNTMMKDSLSNMQENNFNAAQEKQIAIERELARLANLAESSYQTSRMEDAASRTEKLLEQSSAMQDLLAQNKKFSTEDWKEIEALLKETQETLKDLNDILNSSPEYLPEEFRNSSDLKSVPMQDLKQQASALELALKNHDAQKAKAILKEMLAQLEKAQRSILSAQSQTQAQAQESIASDLRDLKSQYNQLYSKQETILNETQKLKERSLEETRKSESGLLKKLAQAQEKAILEAIALKEKLLPLLTQTSWAPGAIQVLSDLVPKMKEIQAEMKTGNVLFSQDWLHEVISKMESESKALASARLNEMKDATIDLGAPSTLAQTDEKFLDILNIEKDILAQLKQPQKKNIPEDAESKNKFNQLSSEQKKIEDLTKQFIEKMKSTGKKSPAINSEILSSTERSQHHMKQASETLSKTDPDSSLAHQSEALRELKNIGQQINQNAEAMSQAQSSSGMSGGVIPRGRSGGMQGETPHSGNRPTSGGVSRGKVAVPNAKDFVPSKAFREELLESLKEKYPDAQSDTIKNYFKKLAE